MTAKGKINASTVQPGDRIIVKLHRNDAGLLRHVTESATKTGEDVMVARVTGKTFRAASGPYERRGKYVIETTAGAFEAAPIQTMWLAPEDAAGVKRAHAEALVEHTERLADEAKAEVNKLGKELGDAWQAEEITTEDFDKIAPMHQAAVDASKACEPYRLREADPAQVALRVATARRALAWVREARECLDRARQAGPTEARVLTGLPVS